MSPLKILLSMEDYQKSFTGAANEMLLSFRDASYQNLTDALFSKGIYYGDAYVRAFETRGIKIEQIVPDCEILQHKWAEEEMRRERKIEKILIEQVKKMKTDAVWVFSGVSVVSRELLQELSHHTKTLILWWSSKLTPSCPYDAYDLIFSGIPSLVSHFERQGLRAAYLPHAFDERFLLKNEIHAERIPRAVFAGSVDNPAHQGRIELLDYLSRRIRIDFYGYGLDRFAQDSPIRVSSHAPVWGNDLYRLYGSSLVTVHKNIDTAGNFCSAKRIFEACGMGTCLVTEASDDLANFLEPDSEVVTYREKEECYEKIQWLLAHPTEALKIGQKAQQKILSEHTYQKRVSEILKILNAFELTEKAEQMEAFR